MDIAFGAGNLKAFIERQNHNLAIYDENKADLFLADLGKKALPADFPLINSEILNASEDNLARRLIKAVFSASPYLTQIILRSPETLEHCLASSPEDSLETFISQLQERVSKASAQSEVMAALRRFKRDVALLTGLADLAGIWEVMQTTAALTKCADIAVSTCVRYLFDQAAQKGDCFPENSDEPEVNSGYFVLAMGKHGAHELNYSSDIDLIVFYEPGLLKLKEGLDQKVFFVNITRALVKLMHERTSDGYVFRTDLRLRPDPGSTQVAISTNAALTYYESMGQNWERAVFIKARPIAGDIPAAKDFLKHLSPFIWRKYLDFASIAEVHAMKRQIHAHKGHGKIAVAGHNIKLGKGGIREIEFFVQTQQLIAGGRQPELRSSPTLVTMKKLVEKKWVKQDVADDLTASYLFLRHVEHRLQMISDEQTHTLPTDKEALKRVAVFSGYENFEDFSKDLMKHLTSVQSHYAELFEDMPSLNINGLDPIKVKDTLVTADVLSRMGFSDTEKGLATIDNWHSGRYMSMRSKQARARLTDFQLVLLDALSKTAEPDQALISFDRFLANLPAGIQLFSLLKSNPNLLRLLADIMGTAPRLSQFLSRHSRVLDAVLDPGFFGEVPTDEVLEELITKVITDATDYQDVLDGIRSIGQEKAFLIGVRTLSGTISAAESGYAYAKLAEFLIDPLVDRVKSELESKSGKIKDGEVAVLAMGKLGGREMTASSDLDIIVIYDFDQDCLQSDGSKALAPTQYYNRLTQRLLSALSAPTTYGSLYEVDTRLRPSGRSGPLATRFDSFSQYQKESAWTWEHMALTRARIISSTQGLEDKLNAEIKDILTAPRDPEKIALDVRDMRKRIANEHGTLEHWHIKRVRGGLLDVEFITQYLQLIHAHKHPEILDQNTRDALAKISKAGLITEYQSETLIEAARLYSKLIQILRLCVSDQFSPDSAPPGLKNLLVRTSNDPAFSQLEANLREKLAAVKKIYDEILGEEA